MDSARRAERELGAHVIVISKSSKEYAAEKDAPPCPSVKVDHGFLVKRGLIAYEQLKAALLQEPE